jgi:hypothetical protein
MSPRTHISLFSYSKHSKLCNCHAVTASKYASCLKFARCNIESVEVAEFFLFPRLVRLTLS